MTVTRRRCCAKSQYPPGNHLASHLLKVLFPGHNHLLTTGTDDCMISTSAWVINKVNGHQHRWLADGYDLEIGHF